MKTAMIKKINKSAYGAKKASRVLAGLSSEKKNEVLTLMAQALMDNKETIICANKKDLKNAQEKKLPAAFIERLTVSEKRLNEMAQSLLEISKLQDPVGKDIKTWSRPNGLLISKVRVPIGVILIIYESRPNVTSDCIGLCFKSGNAVILRGGSEALCSNVAI